MLILYLINIYLNKTSMQNQTPVMVSDTRELAKGVGTNVVITDCEKKFVFRIQFVFVKVFGGIFNNSSNGINFGIFVDEVISFKLKSFGDCAKSFVLGQFEVFENWYRPRRNIQQHGTKGWVQEPFWKAKNVLTHSHILRMQVVSDVILDLWNFKKRKQNGT